MTDVRLVDLLGCYGLAVVLRDGASALRGPASDTELRTISGLYDENGSHRFLESPTVLSAVKMLDEMWRGVRQAVEFRTGSLQ